MTNVTNIFLPQYPNPVKTVLFRANVDLSRARLDLEACDVQAHIDLTHKAVIDLTIKTCMCGGDYTSALTTAQLKDLEDEALYYAGIQ